MEERQRKVLTNSTVSSFSKVDSNDGVETFLTIDPAQSGDAEVGLSDGTTAVVCASGEVIGSVRNGATLTVLCGRDTSGVATSDGGTVN